VVCLAHRSGAIASISKLPAETFFATPEEVGYDAYQGLERWDKDPYEEALADSTTLLRGMWEVTRPASQRGTEGERNLYENVKP